MDRWTDGEYILGFRRLAVDGIYYLEVKIFSAYWHFSQWDLKQFYFYNCITLFYLNKKKITVDKNMLHKSLYKHSNDKISYRAVSYHPNRMRVSIT